MQLFLSLQDTDSIIKIRSIGLLTDLILIMLCLQEIEQSKEREGDTRQWPVTGAIRTHLPINFTILYGHSGTPKQFQQ